MSDIAFIPRKPFIIFFFPSMYVVFGFKCKSFFSFHCFPQLSLAAVSAILKQQKRKKKKIVVDIGQVSGVTPCYPDNPLAPGDRLDNKWHQYNSSQIPQNKEEWDACTFVPKTHFGYYCWPRCVFVEILQSDFYSCSEC